MINNEFHYDRRNYKKFGGKAILFDTGSKHGDINFSTGQVFKTWFDVDVDVRLKRFTKFYIEIMLDTKLDFFGLFT